MFPGHRKNKIMGFDTIEINLAGTGAELGKMHLNHKTNGSLSRAELRWIRAKVN